jgi:WD40 repeat protein
MTGSTDGLIRVVEILPNKVLGIVGDHDNFPVECIRASGDRKYLASIAHDDVVRFWNIDMFNEVSTDKCETFESSDEDEEGAAGEDDEMVDDDDDEEEGDDDDDIEMSEDSRFSDDSSDDEGAGGSSRTMKTATEKFYSDL